MACPHSSNFTANEHRDDQAATACRSTPLRRHVKWIDIIAGIIPGNAKHHVFSASYMLAPTMHSMTERLEEHMKRVTLLMIILAIGCGSAWAAPITAVTVADQHSNWDGYTGGSYAQYGSYGGYQAGDVIGIPDIKNISFSFLNAHLVSLTIDFNLPNATAQGWWNQDQLKPGDIFIDKDQDKDWDYIVHNPDSLARPTNVTDIAKMKNSAVKGEWSVYTASGSGLDYSKPGQWASEYNLSTVYEANLNSWDWRKNHPIQALNPGSVSGVTATVNWPQSSNSMKDIYATWTFGNGGIDLKGYHSMTVAFAMNCANDVFFEKDIPIPNPEPGTMLLMGVGALGAAFLRRRAKKAPL